MKNVVIVDVNAYIHRNYHALDARLDIKGNCNRVSHGVFNLIKKLDGLAEIDELVLVIDSDDGSLYRENIFSEYKANRPEKELDFLRQKKELVRILSNTGFITIIYPGYEADDAIASIAKSEGLKGNNVLVVSPDKDLMQIVTENIYIMKNYKEGGETGFHYYNIESVKEYMGVEPKYIADMLALMGDVSDNIPGIDGLGQKTAAKIINHIGGIEMIINNMDELKVLKINSKIITQIESRVNMLPIMKQLTKVVDNLDISLPLFDIKLFNNKKKILTDFYNFPEYLVMFDFMEQKKTA